MEITSDMSQTVWIEAQQQWVSSQDLSYHPCLEVRSQPGVLQAFEWSTSAWGSNSTWATFPEIHMQGLLLQEVWGHWSIVVEVFYFLVMRRSLCSQPLLKQETSWWTFAKVTGISNISNTHLKGISWFLWHNHHPTKYQIVFYGFYKSICVPVPFLLPLHICLLPLLDRDPATCPEMYVKAGAGQVCTSSCLWTPVEFLVWGSRQELALARETKQSSTLAELLETGTE